MNEKEIKSVAEFFRKGLEQAAKRAAHHRQGLEAVQAVCPHAETEIKGNYGMLDKHRCLACGKEFNE